MKVALVSTLGVKCGISTYSTYLGDELNKLTNVFVTGLAEFPFPDDRAIDTFKPSFPYYNCWQRSEPYKNLIEESKKFDYDIYHIQHQFGLFSNEQDTIELYEKCKKPIITTLHDVVQPDPRMSRYFSSIIENSSKLIVHTKTCYDLLQQWNCPTSKIELIPHGTKLIDVPDKLEARRVLQIPEKAKVILSWGFIWESKGILDLVKILTEVKKVYPETILVHAGGVHPIIQGSSYLQNIFKTALKDGLTPKDLIVTGWLAEDKVPLYFSASDLIVLNYMRGSASASGAAHRAMAAHRPLVGTDDPCLNGDIPRYIVPRFDINALKDGIVKVLSDEVLQKSLVEQADKVAQETSWSNTAKKHLAVYSSSY